MPRTLLIYQTGTDSTTLPVPGPSTISGPDASNTRFDANVVMILAVILCALIAAVGINSTIRCAVRCLARVGLTLPEPEPEPEPSRRAIHLPTVGIRRKAILAIPVMVYSDSLKLCRSGSECAICLSDLSLGELVRVLPRCNHGFHACCIDMWLMTRPSCPTCRQTLVVTNQKSSDCRDVNPNWSEAGQVQSVIVPLEPEGYVSYYRADS